MPDGTQSLAIVCHDPDAPLVDGFTHWVVYGIDAEVAEVAEGDDSHSHGKNSAGEAAYMGPAPPPGHGTHHYYFWVYALDSAPDLDPGLTRRELIDRIEDQVIEQNRIVGTYSR